MSKKYVHTNFIFSNRTQTVYENNIANTFQRVLIVGIININHGRKATHWQYGIGFCTLNCTQRAIKLQYNYS